MSLSLMKIEEWTKNDGFVYPVYLLFIPVFKKEKQEKKVFKSLLLSRQQSLIVSTPNIFYAKRYSHSFKLVIVLLGTNFDQ